MRPPRRMRRFADQAGREYDELPNGQLRRRLARHDPGPHPMPEPVAVIERRVGRLAELNTTRPDTTSKRRRAALE